MKKSLLIASLTTLLASGTAYADFIGANAEGGVFFGDDDITATYASVDVQHPIPLIPNARLDIWDLEVDNSSFEISHFDLTGYYGVGLLWVGVEAGLTFRELETSATGFSESESVPMLYLAGSVAIPGTGITLVAESKSISSYDDVTISDEQFKIQYQPLPIVGLEVGYRAIDQETSSTDLDYDGYFVGLTIDI